MQRAEADRRPIAQRQSRWAETIAARLARIGLRPNQISALSVVVSVLAGSALAFGGQAGPGLHLALFTAAALLAEMRLLCNLFDGMLAVEGGMGSRSGVIWNDLPDRLSDAAILVGAGYATGDPVLGGALGWVAALLAVLTAYVRVLGGSAGVAQDFGGPMAKQQRMHVIAAAALIGALAGAGPWSDRVLSAALALIAVGSAWTVARRTRTTVRRLEVQ